MSPYDDDDDSSPSSMVPRSAFYDVESPAAAQCSPRKAARVAHAEGGGGRDERDACDGGRSDEDDSGRRGNAKPAPKRVSFASHVQFSSSSSSSLSSASRSRRERPRKTKGGDDEEEEDEEDSDMSAKLKVAMSILVLIAAAATAAGCIFAAGMRLGRTTAAGSSSPSKSAAIVEDQRWQAAPWGGETVLGKEGGCD